MDKPKAKSINDFRLRFNDLSQELEHLRNEWLEAHDRKDIDRETALAHREKDLLNQVDNVIKGLAGLLKESRAA